MCRETRRHLYKADRYCLDLVRAGRVPPSSAMTGGRASDTSLTRSSAGSEEIGEECDMCSIVLHIDKGTNKISLSKVFITLKENHLQREVCFTSQGSLG